MSGALSPELSITTAGSEAQASLYISKLLTAIIGDDSDTAHVISGDLTSHSARRGAAIHAASCAEVRTSDLAHRGRSWFERLHALFGYLSET